MKIPDLEFIAAGCCGDHLSASVDVGDIRLLITKNDDDNYTVARMKGGLLSGPLLRGQSAADVEVLLQGDA